MLLSMQKEEEKRVGERECIHLIKYNDIKQDCDALYTTR